MTKKRKSLKMNIFPNFLYFRKEHPKTFHLICHKPYFHRLLKKLKIISLYNITNMDCLNNANITLSDPRGRCDMAPEADRRPRVVQSDIGE